MDSSRYLSNHRESTRYTKLREHLVRVAPNEYTRCSTRWSKIRRDTSEPYRYHNPCITLTLFNPHFSKGKNQGGFAGESRDTKSIQTPYLLLQLHAVIILTSLPLLPIHVRPRFVHPWSLCVFISAEGDINIFEEPVHTLM